MDEVEGATVFAGRDEVQKEQNGDSHEFDLIEKLDPAQRKLFESLPEAQQNLFIEKLRSKEFPTGKTQEVFASPANSSETNAAEVPGSPTALAASPQGPEKPDFARRLNPISGASDEIFYPSLERKVLAVEGGMVGKLFEKRKVAILHIPVEPTGEKPYEEFKNVIGALGQDFGFQLAEANAHVLIQIPPKVDEYAGKDKGGRADMRKGSPARRFDPSESDEYYGALGSLKGAFNSGYRVGDSNVKVHMEALGPVTQAPGDVQVGAVDLSNKYNKAKVYADSVGDHIRDHTAPGQKVLVVCLDTFLDSGNGVDTLIANRVGGNAEKIKILVSKKK